jgi:predicted PhzF superfamily epimerase YddE/YHI9
VTELHVLRVFLGPGGTGGNPLGVFLEPAAVEPARYQAVATELGFSETVFVESLEDEAVAIRIFTPGTELPFAGHPTVGTSWLLRETGRPSRALRVPAGEVPAWEEGGLAWVRGRPEWIQPIEMPQLGSAAEIESLTGPPTAAGSWYPWAWIDEPAGVLRSRYFFTDAGIGEDEATGAAAVLIGSRLGRPLRIRQGVGSELHVRPGPDGSVEVGGRVVLDDVRAFDPSHPVSRPSLDGS